MDASTRSAPGTLGRRRSRPPSASSPNEALVSRVESLTGAERESFTVVMFGRMTMDLAGVLGMRLSEHAVHAWDVEVALDPAARIAPDAVGLLAVRLPMMAGFMGKKHQTPKIVEVTTSDPAMTFTLDTGGVTLTPGSTGASASLALPAEPFVRLVYGRLTTTPTLRRPSASRSPNCRRCSPGSRRFRR